LRLSVIRRKPEVTNAQATLKTPFIDAISVYIDLIALEPVI